MRILHTADLHFGQNIYQNYDRLDEHLHFFSQLKKWIDEYNPDVLLISGDIYDVAQPSAAIWSAFNSRIVDLRRSFPELTIVIVAGNHDSAARIEAHSKVWEMAGVTMVGTPPPILHAAEDGWEDRYIVRLPSGFVIALPYMSGERADTMLHLQKYVENLNADNLPVVMTAHLAAIGCDTEGHDPEIGNLRPVAIQRFGTGYDYLALGHIHKPQTLGYPPVYDDQPHSYPSPAARYSGSVLHVSEDENYPHSVSLIDIDRHGGDVTVRQLRIEQLRHFLTLPADTPKPFDNVKEAMRYLTKFLKTNDKAYIRLRFHQDAVIPADFNATVYTLIEQSGKDIRYNPRMIFVSDAEDDSLEDEGVRPRIDIEEIKQITDPRKFVRMTAQCYPLLSEDDLDELFDEVDAEIRRMSEGK